MGYWPSIPSSHRPARRPVDPRESIRRSSSRHSLRLIGRRQITFSTATLASKQTVHPAMSPALPRRSPFMMHSGQGLNAAAEFRRGDIAYFVIRRRDWRSRCRRFGRNRKCQPDISTLRAICRIEFAITPETQKTLHAADANWHKLYITSASRLVPARDAVSRQTARKRAFAGSTSRLSERCRWPQ